MLRSSPKLIFATNRNLEKMVVEGTFRKDLWMRINMFPILMPTLEERKEDIPEIIRALLPKSCTDTGIFVTFDELPQDFIDYLCSVPVDGNIRGVQNQLEILLVLSPKDRCGRPVFKKWKQVPGLVIKKSNTVSASDPSETLSIVDLLNRPTSVIGPNFPGLNVVLESVTNRILSEAMTMFSKNKEIAKALKIPESSTSMLVKRLNAGKSVASIQTPSQNVESGVLQ